MTAELNLEKAGIQTDKRGAIVVDNQLRTTAPHVWALGLSLIHIYFMLIKGLKDSSFMTPENKQWIHDNTALLITCLLYTSRCV